jgi:hypothetical protein
MTFFPVFLRWLSISYKRREKKRKRRVSIMADPEAGNVITLTTKSKNNLDYTNLTKNREKKRTDVIEFNLLVLKSGKR